MHPVFLELFRSLPRQGPGSSAATRRAWEAAAAAVRPRPRVLDVGCGSGAATLALAVLGAACVSAVDVSRDLLQVLRSRADRRGLPPPVRPLQADMARLPFAVGAFDVVWSEGAVYNLGVEQALRRWRRLLATPGALALSELSWRRAPADGPAGRHWARAYPRMRTRDANLAACEEAGFTVLDCFPLGEDAWWSDFYAPLRERLGVLRRRNAADPEATAVLDEVEAEIALFEDHGESYDYFFYVLGC